MDSSVYSGLQDLNPIRSESIRTDPRNHGALLGEPESATFESGYLLAMTGTPGKTCDLYMQVHVQPKRCFFISRRKKVPCFITHRIKR